MLLFEIVRNRGGIEITIAFVQIFTEEGREKDVAQKVTKLMSLEIRVEEARLCYFGRGEKAVFVKLSTEMTEKKLNRWIRKEIRALDAVWSIGILTVVSLETKHEEPINENWIDDEEEGENWGPWR